MAAEVMANKTTSVKEPGFSDLKDKNQSSIVYPWFVLLNAGRLYWNHPAIWFVSMCLEWTERKYSIEKTVLHAISPLQIVDECTTLRNAGKSALVSVEDQQISVF